MAFGMLIVNVILAILSSAEHNRFTTVFSRQKSKRTGAWIFFKGPTYFLRLLTLVIRRAELRVFSTGYYSIDVINNVI